ncbi:FadD3 family acyl-CoA ligase [Pseudonocardia lutea]|uniref:FadD3 family acyl-CoA ligase n=1 Tax=Pseudonocardia lutea TaxID=2172015 RepID=A0ABW1IBE2_9PSEU
MTMTHPQTVPALVDRAAALFGPREAVADGETRQTWSQLRAAVRAWAGSLLAGGLGRGERVAVWAPNTHDWIAAALGVLYTGGVVVPVNTRFTAAEAADVVRRSRSVAVVVVGEFLGTDRGAELRALPGEGVGPVPAAPAVRSVYRIGDGPGERRAPAETVDARAAAVTPDDLCDVLFTSGTTGVSKGAMSAHRQTVGAAAAWAGCFAIAPEDRYLAVNPFFHSFGYKAGILVCLLTGATIVPQAVFDVDELVRMVERERITVLPGPPAIYQSMLDHPAVAAADLGGLRLAVTGADVVSETLVERMRAELGFDEVLTAYGMTEAVVATLCRPGDPADVVTRTSGRAAPGMEVRVTDAAGTPLPPGTAGEVRLRGPNVMLGYLDDPAATAEAVDAEGWLHTGDVGVLDAAGNLRITDRLKDMYISGGFNVYPAEVERALARIDGVAEVAVVGVPDDRMGRVGKAFVVPRPGAALDADAVAAFCRAELANYKRPRVIEFREALPRNASGKVLKRQLAD